jgi:alkylation response protein AidB-like acyl-CoA dehydrogenase
MSQRVTGHRAVVAVQDAETYVPNGVRLDCAEAGGHDYFAELGIRTEAAAGDVHRGVALARELGAELPAPGAGRTRDRWSALATLGAVDLTVARVAEPHLDAFAILAEAGHPELGDDALAGSWGVYAAESPSTRLRAQPNPGRDARAPNAWHLDGVKPWCSLAEVVDHALVTAWIDEEQRGMFAVSLRQPSVTTASGGWVSHGLRNVRSTPTSYRSADATLIGSPGWYLRRDGFAWGGIGVAAVWYGGAVGIARRLLRQASERELDQIGWAHLGTVDATLHAARSVLLESAGEIDRGRAQGRSGVLLALRVRQIVAEAVETTIRAADHALGPGPLASETEHATRVSDLRIYVRQHHAERDAAALGRAVYAAPDQQW